MLRSGGRFDPAMAKNRGGCSLPSPQGREGAAFLQSLPCDAPRLRYTVSVSVRFEYLPGFTVTVDEVQYDPTRPAPPDRPHPFIYHVSIHNDSQETVNIFGRKWIVRDTDGDTLVVEGD